MLKGTEPRGRRELSISKEQKETVSLVLRGGEVSRGQIRQSK